LQVFSPSSHATYLDPGYAGAGETQGDALAAAGVGYFVGPNVVRMALHDKPHHARKHKHRKIARHFARPEPVREGRAALDRPASPGVAVPLPSAPPPVATAPAAANPLLAPLASASAAPPARADDMPLPAHAAAPKPAPAASASIPLPN
jgi:hypothetical protein